MSLAAGDRITLSVVSHGQAALIGELLRSLGRHCRSPIELVITSNLPEPLDLPADVGFPLRRIVNATPRGFGENHNAAFRQSGGEYFCVLNPDIRFTADPFPELLGQLRREAGAGVVAPLVTTPDGALEDSARDFPTPWSILKKFFGWNRDRQTLGEKLGSDAVEVDWVAGMFMLFPRQVFADLGGFDERYFLYYEDVDLCDRLHHSGFRVLIAPGAGVVHDARRDSHRKLHYLRWHLASMLRFFLFHFLRRWRRVAR